MFSNAHRRFFVIWVNLLLVMMVARGQDSIFVLDTLLPEYHLNDYLRVWEDTTEKATFETVSQPAYDILFQPYSQVKPLQNQLGVYWSKSVLTNQITAPHIIKNWFLWIGEGSYIDVYFTSTDGSLREYQRTGELVPAREKKLKTGNRVERVPFSLAMGDTMVVFTRLQRVDYHEPLFNFKLTSVDYMEGRGALLKNREHWFFLGFLTAITIFSYLLYLTTNDRAYLYHGLFLSAATIFILDTFGPMPDIPLFRNNPTWALYLNYLSQACWDVFFLQFFRSYMVLDKVLPWWDRVLKYLIRLRIGYFILVFTYFLITFNEVLADRATILYVFAQYFIILFFLAALFRLHDPKAYFLIGATLFFLLGVAVNGYQIMFGIPVNWLFSTGALTGEILLFSRGLAYRMGQLQEEEIKAQRLAHLDELKNHLYANITHEFRTPLTIINGMVEQLMKKMTDNPERSLQLIRQSSDQLLNLVNRLLDLARIESGELRLSPARGDILAYLHQLVEFFQPVASQKGITISLLSSLPSLEMDFDAEVVRQIFSNILSNAIKFTQRNGSVTVVVEKKRAGGKEQLSVAVSDTGIGIPTDALPHIFDRFYQSGNASRQFGLGTGIGLALTRELVTLAGGSIEVKSNTTPGGNKGTGTTFTVLLPIEQQTQAAMSAPEELSPPPDDNWQPVVPQEYVTTKPPRRGFQKNLVLIIEDNPHVVEYMRALLEDHFEVEVAFNGQDGVTLALETIPDVIVSDVIMPGMDGFAVLQTLKKDIRTSHVPIVLLTALASVKDRIAGLKMGADAYLGKPFEGTELLAVLNNLMEQRDRLQAYFFNNKYETSEDEKLPEPLLEDAFLMKAREILQRNMENENFGVLQLQRALAVSRTQLHRKLKALTGMSTTEFINYMRLQKARELLHDPTMHIGEIAYDSGFKDPNYFTRLFVKYFGKSPTEYRLNLKNNLPPNSVRCL